MYKKSLIIAALTGGLMLSLPSCKKYLDVNDNPNIVRPDQIQPALLLPTAQLGIGSSLGVDFQINGSFWAQYWTQYYLASQYRSLDQYQPDASRYDRVWGILYNDALTDLKKLDQVATAQNLSQYSAVAKLLTAYTFQLITDAWGDVPFTEALNGLSEDGGISSPRYDRQEVVYNGIIQMVDDALALINLDDPLHPGSDDLIYHGDMELWEKFGNTLKLRMLLRLSEVNAAKSQAGIQALYATSPSFIDEDEDALINYVSTSGNQNPLYTEMVGLDRVQNAIASSTSVDSFVANDDPRVLSFYVSAIGVRQGFYNAPSTTPFSPPNALVGANATSTASATAPVKLLTSYESKFLQAEAAARGWGTGDAQDLFEEGINYNFVAYGLDATDASDYIANSYWGAYPASGTVAQQVRHIITQKWFSMNGNQGFEAWTEWRRTGYPDFLVLSANSQIGNRFPARFFYPNNELTRNINFPGQKLIYDRVWWDIN